MGTSRQITKHLLRGNDWTLEPEDKSWDSCWFLLKHNSELIDIKEHGEICKKVDQSVNPQVLKVNVDGKHVTEWVLYNIVPTHSLIQLHNMVLFQ